MTSRLGLCGALARHRCQVAHGEIVITVGDLVV